MVLRVLICGGGNGGHVLAALTALRPNTECRILTLTQAERWNRALGNKRLALYPPHDVGQVHLSRPRIISSNPARVVPGCDAIILSLPAFYHKKYLEILEPYIVSPTIIVGLPGQQGFEFQIYTILNHKLPLLTVLSAETLPWACRVMEFGVSAKVIGYKHLVKVTVARQNGNLRLDALEMLQSILGGRPVLQKVQHYMALSPMFAAQHVGILYGKWNSWDGVPLQIKPLFYHGVDDVQSEILSKTKDELDMLIKKFASKRPNIDLTGWESGFSWLVKGYGPTIEDRSSLQTAVVSNKAYTGLTHPMKEVKGGYIPDFSTRYLTEDVPFTLVVLKGLAELVELETPVITSLIQWGQEKLGKEYLVGGKLIGQDIRETRAPQAYGIHSLQDLEYMEKEMESQ